MSIAKSFDKLYYCCLWQHRCGHQAPDSKRTPSTRPLQDASINAVVRRSALILIRAGLHQQADDFDMPFFRCMHQCRAVAFISHILLGAGPASTSKRTTSTCPFIDAYINAVRRCPSLTSFLAPASTSKRTTSTCPSIDAYINAVQSS